LPEYFSFNPDEPVNEDRGGFLLEVAQFAGQLARQRQRLPAKLETIVADWTRKYEQFRRSYRRLPEDADAVARVGQRLSYLEQEAAASSYGYRGNEGIIQANLGRRLERKFDTISSTTSSRSRSGKARKKLAQCRLRRAVRVPLRPSAIRFVLRRECDFAHNEDDSSPVIFETNATYTNLFGTIQRSYDSRGGWNSDFVDLRPVAASRGWWFSGSTRLMRSARPEYGAHSNAC